MKKIALSVWNYLRTYYYGQWATAFFFLCAVSGVILALPYDVHDAWRSISKIMVFNPWAAFFRNFHYWTAQLFLISTLVHMLDYGLRKGYGKVNPGVWLRLVLSLLFIFFVMISGFILKDDPDSRQAIQILDAMISAIPFMGERIKDFFLGRSGDLQVIYIHHVATATLALLMIIIEHSRRLWTTAKPAFHALILTIILSLLWAAPLHDGISEVAKGPWYFLGLQEFLHYFSSPLPAIISFIVWLLVIYFMRFMSSRLYRLAGYFLIITAFAYALLTFIGLFFRGAYWEWVSPAKYNENRHIVLNPWVPLWKTFIDTLRPVDSVLVLGRYEGCLNCHGGMQGFSPSHAPASMGCASCHLGNPYTLSKTAAHRGMILVPGNLATARLTCGSAHCHADITTRIQSSLMTTLSGMVSVDRFVFGELNQPHGFFHINDLRDSPADIHLRNLCAGCHLGQPKNLPGEAHYLEKGGGCNACHLQYDSATVHWVERYYRQGIKDRLPQVHPRLTMDISNDRCASCHIRSGRITESYAGWYETLTPAEKISPNKEFRIIEGKRIFMKTAADVHHMAGLACMDCHDSKETMGDGTLYAHKEDAVKIHCADCHKENLSAPFKATQLDAEARKILALRDYLQNGKAYAVAQKSRRPILNIQEMEGGKIQLISRLDGQLHDLRAPGKVCNAAVHSSLSCQACHSTWAPTCLGCHNSFNPTSKGWDFKTQSPIRGTWQEAAGLFEARQPSLGVRVIDGKREIIPFVPGMVLSIDFRGISADKPKSFHRLFAPIDPHTTSRAGLHCKACHNNSVALGYGAGRLDYSIVNGKGVWRFDSEYAPLSEDGLPPDAWIGFMKHDATFSSTRLNHRPFTTEEQKKILRVGACLHCHGENPPFTQRLLFHYQEMIFKRSPRCYLPD